MRRNQLTRLLEIGLLLICLLAAAPLLAQQTAAPGYPTGRFLTDTIEIGKPFQYSLRFLHSPQQEVLFPDTAQHFAPFLVRGIAIFPTVTGSVGSLDSAVYTLVSFETTPAQLLSVRIRLVNANDCTALFTPTDTVFLRSHVQSAQPDTLALATETTIVPLQQQFNYSYLFIVLVSIGATICLIYLLFGSSIRRQWRLYRLYQYHMRFLREYNRLIRTMNPDTAADLANQVMVRWKAYLERLEQRTFTSLTTREIVEQINDNRLADALKEADRMIYGGTFSYESQHALRVLRDVAAQAYHRRRNSILSQSKASRPKTSIRYFVNARANQPVKP